MKVEPESRELTLTARRRGTMSVVSLKNAEVIYKIVYIGPEGSGKTTTIEKIYGLTGEEMRGPLRRISTQRDANISLDLLTLKLGFIQGFRRKAQLCAPPGCREADEVRDLILKGADCVVFVADAQIERVGANLDFLYNLRATCLETSDPSGIVPVIYQFNKYDLSKTVEPQRLAEILGVRDDPYFTTIAIDGTGVYEPLHAAIKIVLSEEFAVSKATVPA
jgi:hypothetical protein